MTTADQTMAQSDHGKQVIEAVSLKVASGDLRGLIHTLPDLELLWQQEPLAYLKAVKLNVHVLIASSDADAKKAALNTFSKVLDKTSPVDTVTATAYFGIKDGIIGYYCNLEEVRANKDRLLMIASFLGEVRSLRIPDYQNRGTNLPAREILDAAGVNEVADLPTQAQKDAVAVAVKKNIEDNKMNRLQSALLSVDRGLTFKLIEPPQAFSVANPENREFYQELATRARLTAEERKKLQLPK